MKFILIDTLRTIKNNFARFFAIAGMIALAVGFYAALLMTSNDMKLSATEYYNNTNFMDICVVSTQGMTEDNIKSYKDIDDVDGVMPARETDALANLEGTQGVVRIQSLSDSAYNSEIVNDMKVISDDKNYISRPVLVEGSWPRHADECVVGADVVGSKKLNIGDKIQLLESTYDINKTMANKELKITGLVNSSTYVCTSALGHTSLGDGMINQYIFVPFSSFSDKYPITDCYIKVKGADQYISGSEEYQHLVDKVMAKIAELNPGLTDIRSASASSYAEQMYNEAMSQLQGQKDAVNNELASNEQKLNESLNELEGGAWQIQFAEQQISAAYAQFNQQRIDAQRQFNEARAEMDRKANIANNVINSVSSNYSEIEASANIITAGYSDQVLPNLLALNEKLATTQQRCNTAVALLGSIVTDPEAMSQLTYYYNLYRDYAARLQANSASFAADLQGINIPTITYSRHIDGWVTIAQGAAKAYGFVNNINSQVNDAVNEGYAEIARKEAEVNAQIATAQAELDAAAAELRQKASQANLGRDEYLSALEKFNTSRAGALSQLQAAENQINSASADALSNLPATGYYVLDRSKNYGAINFLNDADRIYSVAQVLPFIIFIVMAIVVLAAMTGMVEDERRNFAILKSMGYSKFKAPLKLTFYAIIAVVIGSFFGLLILPQVLPASILSTYSIMYHVPFTFPMPFNMQIAIISELIGLVIVFAAMVTATAGLLRRPIAFLLSYKNIRPDKKILLERIKPIWMLFTHKFRVTLRNVFGYKKRLAAGLVGIICCTALLFTGFGLNDSINDVVNKQFNNVMHDNYSADFSDTLTDAQKAEVEQMITSQDPNAKIVYTYSNHVVALPEGKPDANVNIICVSNEGDLGQMRSLVNRETKEQCQLTDDGVLVTEKLARLMNVRVGDNISVYKQDQVGNASMTGWDLKVSGIVENYISHYIYATPEFVKQTIGDNPNSNSLMCTINVDQGKMSDFNNSITALPYVKSAGFNNDSQDSYWSLVGDVEAIVALVGVVAAILMIIVLISLARLVLHERKHDVSMLKVLGYKVKHVGRYFGREIFVICVIATIIGIFLGFGLESLVIDSAEFDYCMFGRDIYPMSIVLTMLSSFVIAIIVSFLTRRKIYNSIVANDGTNA